MVNAKVLHFYCDESFVFLEKKKHVIIGIIAIENEDELLGTFINLKRKLKIGAFTELKWNSKGFSKEQKFTITEEFLNLEGQYDGIILLTEGTELDTNTFSSMLSQIEKYCAEECNGATYSLAIDSNFIRKAKSEFTKLIDNGLFTKCIEFDIADSSTNQLIQCADLFTGFYNLLLTILDKGNDKKILLPESWGYGSEYSEISWMLKMGFRYRLWGESLGFRENGIGPYKNSFGKGLKIIQSTISPGLQEKIKDFFSEIYMGCIH